VFLVAFLVLAGFLTFGVAMLYERRQADLTPFFFWHPWVYLLLVPAATMGSWAEERRNGTIELLLTLPVTLTQALVGKFLAAWAVVALALALTFPVWITVNYLGSPDNGVIVAGYIGSLLMAGAFLAIIAMTSAMTRSQIVSFLIALVICLFLILAGWPPVTDLFTQWAPTWLVDTVAAFSVMSHFESIQKGVAFPIDVYDAAAWMAVTCLSEQSIALGSMPVAVPDFTAGRWMQPDSRPGDIFSLNAVYPEVFD
jgi:ABC-2 type transport system permease protein